MNAEDLPTTAAPAPPPGTVVTGRYHQEAGYRINRPQGSTSWLLIWTTDGAGLVRQGAVRTRARPGDLVVLAPGGPHSYAVDPGVGRWGFWWTHCRARPAWVPWLGPCALGGRRGARPPPRGAPPPRLPARPPPQPPPPRAAARGPH
ncbi:AraC family ligand binding domain-containing protein, partial [Streptomyces sp. NPDC127079]|uniref:AraC family ligand binding domain-containing protein n=1 Tax=Streptomyces sp. NPDC127079 TaxID=3347132 RepID=UPI003649A5C0